MRKLNNQKPEYEREYFAQNRKKNALEINKTIQGLSVDELRKIVESLSDESLSKISEAITKSEVIWNFLMNVPKDVIHYGKLPADLAETIAHTQNKDFSRFFLSSLFNEISKDLKEY